MEGSRTVSYLTGIKLSSVLLMFDQREGFGGTKTRHSNGRGRPSCHKATLASLTTLSRLLPLHRFLSSVFSLPASIQHLFQQPSLTLLQ